MDMNNNKIPFINYLTFGISKTKNKEQNPKIIKYQHVS